METGKLTVPDILEMARKGIKITMLTVFDYPLAAFCDRAGIDILLVGDSLGMAVLGYTNTVPVTMEEMIHHTKAVVRGTKRALVVADMPFMSYQVSEQEAIRNAGRLIKEGGADAVKLEGGQAFAPIVKAIVNAGIPVMGHIGLTPMFASNLGGFKVQGKDVEAAKGIVADALAIEAAGAFSIALECVPARLAKLITEKLIAPTIGLGAGPHCDGQTMISYDLLGLFERFTPKFAKQYARLNQQIVDAVTAYKNEVISGAFPSDEHCFSIKDSVIEEVARHFA